MSLLESLHAPLPPALPWQASLWQRVQDARAANRLAQALLLSGPAGLGKRSFARRLAASLICEDNAPGDEACGACRSCAQLAAGTHPDLSWLAREFNEKTDKEKRDISMDQLRAMMERLALSSHYGRARVVVIDPADALNLSGINAVLKTVEEPPAGLHILLISERPMALAPTLRSRCQRLVFVSPAREVAQHWLRAALPKLDAAEALEHTGGAPLAALAAAGSGEFDAHRQWRDALHAVAEHRAEPLAAALAVPKDAAATWLRQCQSLLLVLLRALAGAETAPRTAQLAARLGAAQVDALIAETVDAQRRLLSNANPQLLIESLMISWWHRAAPPARR